VTSQFHSRQLNYFRWRGPCPAVGIPDSRMLKQQNAAPRKFTRCLLVLRSAFGGPQAARADRACVASEGPLPEMASQCCREFVRNIAFGFGFVWVCGITYPIWGFRTGVQPIDISPIALGHDIRARSGSNSKPVEHTEPRGESPAAMIARYRTGVRAGAFRCSKSAARSNPSAAEYRGMQAEFCKEWKQKKGVDCPDSNLSDEEDASTHGHLMVSLLSLRLLTRRQRQRRRRRRHYYRLVCIQPRLPAATLSKKEIRRYKSIASKLSRSAASPRPPALPTGRHPRCHCIDRGAPRSPTHPRSLARGVWGPFRASAAARDRVRAGVPTGALPGAALARPDPPRLAPRVGWSPLLSRAPRQRHAALAQTGWFSGERVCGSAHRVAAGPSDV
jgi:hypothetical protein